VTGVPEAAAWGALVGVTLLAGALAAAQLRLPARVASGLTAFGGGLLLSAVALELVPEADAAAGTVVTAAGLAAGTAVFVAADAWLHRDPGMSAMRRAAQQARAGRMTPMPRAAEGRSLAAGLVIDGVPESVALGLMVASGNIGLALVAGVLLGNLVEAYGAARLIGAGAARLFAGIGLALAACTALGATLLAGAGSGLVGGAQAVAAGAVLAVVSVTIVPETFRDIARRVAVALIAGFVGGYLLAA
jgi:zinc transporter, ZIP family